MTPLTHEARVRALARLAKEATNGWACHAKRKREFDEIWRLHHEIDAILLHDSACESESTSHGYTPCQCDERAAAALLADAPAERERDTARDARVDAGVAYAAGAAAGREYGRAERAEPQECPVCHDPFSQCRRCSNADDASNGGPILRDAPTPTPAPDAENPFAGMQEMTADDILAASHGTPPAPDAETPMPNIQPGDEVEFSDVGEVERVYSDGEPKFWDGHVARLQHVLSIKREGRLIWRRSPAAPPRVTETP